MSDPYERKRKHCCKRRHESTNQDYTCLLCTTKTTRVTELTVPVAPTELTVPVAPTEPPVSVTSYR